MVILDQSKINFPVRGEFIQPRMDDNNYCFPHLVPDGNLQAALAERRVIYNPPNLNNPFDYLYNGEEETVHYSRRTELSEADYNKLVADMQAQEHSMMHYVSIKKNYIR